jgi:hypothetical protein
MNIQTTFDLLTGSSEYKSWARKNAAARMALETYWLKLIRGEAVTMPTISNRFGAALAGMVSLFPPVPPAPDPEPEPEPEPVTGLSYPTNSMKTYVQGSAKLPVASGDTWKCETTGDGLSRVHWDLDGTPYAKRIGFDFSISCKLDYSSNFRGVAMRIENYNSNNSNLNQLELARFSDGMWYVVQALYRSSSDKYNQIISKINIPNGARVELRGTLSNVDGQAVTTLFVNGVDQGTTTRHNIEQDVNIIRARFGVVDTSQAGIVSVGACAFS